MTASPVRLSSAQRPDAPSLDALVLAGGRSARLGGTDKAGVVVGRRTLLDHALAAATQVGARRTVVVGPPGLVEAPLLCVQEAPAFGGPAAGLAAGLRVLDADWVLVLACDLPRAPDVGAILLAALHSLLATPGAELTDGLCLVDGGGRTQWLAGVYRRTSLDRAVAEMNGPDGLSGASVARLLGTLDLLAVADPGGVAADVDTWHDVDRARRADPASPAGPVESTDPHALPTPPERDLR
ncbi:Molybdopterin-guanine dinucleotide biosynthesis protein A [Sanguibacter gelidistatuariae]|uniref:Molybdopterin-guanine dinucleotide biosynthesis protein A n=1 Tax=Sanguibacter gelidistatuariae TaxID=1814289 RepID=A0A1G6GQ82_9MICO|nr:NTP transferase domain-containing protein [Sanguibacter gelidistatuariae]SDB84202.1 Molybdopterin-guanine dinucleotide biosynthesis protein A [Sanguibacter gelidistatuariae]